MNERNKRVLVVDDNADLREQIRRYLSDYAFEVRAVADGRAMDDVLATGPVDLVILDLMLPGEDGLSICRRLVRAGEPAVIMVSAAGDEINRVLGLELGADDYLAKPFSPRELLARTRAVLRRRSHEPKSRSPSLDFVFEDFTYSFARRELTAPDGTMILLTAMESSVLGVFLMSPQVILTRDDLLLGGQCDPESRAIDLVISRLRRKLQVHGGAALIKTHRGAGYLLDCAVSQP